MDEQQQPLPKDFFKQFKSKEEFHSFFNQLFKQGVEEMLKGELDQHWVMKNTASKVATAVTAAMARIRKK